jgi:hypothetical protein
MSGLDDSVRLTVILKKLPLDALDVSSLVLRKKQLTSEVPGHMLLEDQ